MKRRSITYKNAGVDILEGDRFVDDIRPLVRKTFRREVLDDIGSFGALFGFDTSKFREPVLVSGTDGVGTKLKIAFMMNRHDTIGVDLVAMCVNDIITSGAEPLFFLDYFAAGKLKRATAIAVIRGIVNGCVEAGCALVGGETAEMPGFYSDGEYDVSGFAVGVVEKKAIVNGRGIKPGDSVIGIASSGIHSNGYSLVRKILFDVGKMDPKKRVQELGCSLGAELLKPTTIYVKAVNAVKKKVQIRGMAHITGGGITGNLPRTLPEGVGAGIISKSWPIHPIFRLIREKGNVSDSEMRRTFNMGIGFIIIVGGKEREKTLSILNRLGFPSYCIGTIEKGVKGVEYV